MYKYSLIIVLLVGTAWAYPPTNILRRSVSEDTRTDEKEVPSQESQVEGHGKDVTQEPDKDTTSEYRLVTVTMTIPKFEPVSAIPLNINSEEIGKESVLDEPASREKKNIEQRSLDQMINIPIDRMEIIDIPNAEVSGYYSPSDIDKILEGTVTRTENSDFQEVQAMNISPVEVRGDGAVVISLGAVDVPMPIPEHHLPNNTKGCESNVEELEKLREDNQVMKKKLDKAEEDLADQIKKSNEERKRVDENWKKVLNETKEKEEEERKALQKNHDEVVKALTKELEDFREKMTEESKNVTEILQEGKRNCEKEFEDYKKTQKAELETLESEHNAAARVLTEKVADLQGMVYEQFKNCTTTIQEEKDVCEKTLKENKEREERERETLQDEYDGVIKLKDEQLANVTQSSMNLVAGMLRQTNECNEMLKTEKEGFKNKLTAQTERVQKDFEELEKSCDADKKEKDANTETLRKLLAECRNIIKN